MTTFETQHLYDKTLTLVDKLLDAEDEDFERCQRLNSIMVELSVLKHCAVLGEQRTHVKEWLNSLDYWDKHSM